MSQASWASLAVPCDRLSQETSLYKASRLKFELTWTRGNRSGNAADPTWNDVQRELNATLSSAGTTQLDVMDAGEVGPVSLQVFSESGRFLLMLGENTIDDYEVRTLYDPARGKGMVPILGNEWDNRTVTNDESLVLESFLQFFETGTVSADLLD